jgi:hypothetical protein
MPPHSRTPTEKIVARITRERKRILFSKIPGSFGNGVLLGSMLHNIGWPQQPRSLLHQCGQSIDVQLFLKLRTNVYYRLVTNVKLLGNAIVVCPQLTKLARPVLGTSNLQETVTVAARPLIGVASTRPICLIPAAKAGQRRVPTPDETSPTRTDIGVSGHQRGARP